jgi:hypothetical protein
MVSLPVIQILDPWLWTSARHYASLLCVQLCMHGYITMDDPESSRGMNDTEDVNAVKESGGEDGVVKVIVHDPPPPSLAAGALAPLPHDPDHGSADNEVSKKRKESSATKKAVPATKNRKKDPKAPKKTMTSFTFFKAAKWSQIKNDNPDESFSKISKLVGVAWKELSDVTKAEWEEKADQEKNRYKNEMDEYSVPSDDNDINDNDGDDDETGNPGRKA